MIIPETPETAAVQWRKSSYSGSGNNCVEVAKLADVCAVRDSKNPGGGQLIFGGESWRAFIADVRRGTYEL